MGACCSLESNKESEATSPLKPTTLNVSHIFGGKESQKPPSAQQEITWYQNDLKAKFKMRHGLKIAFDSMGGEDGKIYEEEFLKFCKEELEYEGDPHLLYRIINFHGRDGYVDKEEFMMSIHPDFLNKAVLHDFREWVHMNFHRVDDIFNHINKDHDKAVTKAEFKEALEKVQYHEDAEILYYILDKNQDEKISCNEMKKYLAFKDQDTRISQQAHEGGGKKPRSARKHK